MTQQENSKVLGDIEWGNGVEETKIVSKLATSTYFKTVTTAQAAADVLQALRRIVSLEAKEYTYR